MSSKALRPRKTWPDRPTIGHQLAEAAGKSNKDIKNSLCVKTADSTSQTHVRPPFPPAAQNYKHQGVSIDQTGRDIN